MNITRIPIIVFLTGYWILSLPVITRSQGQKALPVAGINSAFDELMPVISPDGNTLYFVRTGHPQNMGGDKAGQDIWVSQKNQEAQQWQTPHNPGAPLNNIYNNAISSLSSDGKGAWLNNVYLPRNRMAPGLSYATKINAGWSEPQAITIRQFTPETGFLSFYQATDSILFLSMQTDTTQAEDIFVCRRVGAREWSAPERISAEINTPGFEIAPFLAPDRRTLYFASNGHGGLGDADIFMSRRLDNTWLNWSKPVNLGEEVNTAGFDGYFTLDAAGEQAYFTRENKERADTDIYFIRVVDILPTGSISGEKTNGTGPMLNIKPAEELTVTQPVLPATIFFSVNSAELEPAAQTVLQDIGNKLKTGNNRLVISGHADETGNEAANNRLSERRARAVAAYLKNLGLPAAKISITGYGSSKPVAPNLSAENRAKNRRVEIQME